MLRANLVSSLKTVSPALAGNTIIPILSNYWFTGKDLLAYNDKISISVRCTTDVAGAVPPQLLSLLQTSTAENVDLTFENEELVAKAGRARFRLSVLPKDDFMGIFQMPKPSGDKQTNITETILTAVKNCLRSVAPDSIHIQQMGVTVKTDKDGLTLYAINGVTITKARVKVAWHGRELEHVVLPKEFCQALLDMAKDETAGILIEKDHTLATIGKSTYLFGRLIEPDRYVDFDKAISAHFSDKDTKKVVPIPPHFRRLIDRACITADIDPKKMYTRITVKDGTAELYTKCGPVEVTDKVNLPEHPDIKPVFIEPGLIKAGLDAFTHMLFTETCAVLTGSNTVYLIASVRPTSEKE